MPDFRALISKQGVLQGITTADTLVVGNKVDATGATALSIGNTNATSLSLSRAGATTTVQGPLNLTNATTSLAVISAPTFDAPLSGASLTIGGSLAGTVNLGRSGNLVSIASNVEVLGKIRGIPPVGPGQLLQFSGTLFQNSGYVPGVGQFSTPSAFGFFPVQNANFIFNPADLFGLTNSYRIRVAVRVDSAFNDGLHCMLRQVVIGGVESGVPGLLDFGSGVAQIYQAVSNTLTISTTNWVWLRPYFAAYNGGNGATLQDVTVFLEEWF
jgi:hypothetical protein